jgi:two-component SAPR family response regulator
MAIRRTVRSPARCTGSASSSAKTAREIDRLVERVLGLYRGSFMADDADAAWMIQTRERLRARFQRILARVCRHWQERGEEERARTLHERCAEIEADTFKPTVSDR